MSLIDVLTEDAAGAEVRVVDPQVADLGVLVGSGLIAAHDPVLEALAPLVALGLGEGAPLGVGDRRVQHRTVAQLRELNLGLRSSLTEPKKGYFNKALLEINDSTYGIDGREAYYKHLHKLLSRPIVQTMKLKVKSSVLNGSVTLEIK